MLIKHWIGRGWADHAFATKLNALWGCGEGSRARSAQ